MSVGSETTRSGIGAKGWLKWDSLWLTTVFKVLVQPMADEYRWFFKTQLLTNTSVLFPYSALSVCTAEQFKSFFFYFILYHLIFSRGRIALQPIEAKTHPQSTRPSQDHNCSFSCSRTSLHAENCTSLLCSSCCKAAAGTTSSTVWCINTSHLNLKRWQCLYGSYTCQTWCKEMKRQFFHYCILSQMFRFLNSKIDKIVQTIKSHFKKLFLNSKIASSGIDMFIIYVFVKYIHWFCYTGPCRITFVWCKKMFFGIGSVHLSFWWQSTVVRCPQCQITAF